MPNSNPCDDVDIDAAPPLPPNDIVFQSPGADLILRSCDNKDFHVHKVFLSVVSKVFADMFSAPSLQRPKSPQPDDYAHITPLPVVNVTEDSVTIETLLKFVYPISRPTEYTTHELCSLLAAADKYDMSVAAETFAKEIVSEKRGHPPLVIFSIGKQYGLQDMVETARLQILSGDKDIEQLLQQPFTDELKLTSAYDILVLLRDLVETRNMLKKSALGLFYSDPKLKWCSGCGKGVTPSWWVRWSSEARDMMRSSPSNIDAIFDEGFVLEQVDVALKSCDQCYTNYRDRVCQNYLAEFRSKLNEKRHKILRTL